MECEGIRLRRLSPAMFSSVHSLLETSFFPCSPLATSLGLSQSRQFWTWAWVRSLLLEQTGLAALDSEDQVGTRPGDCQPQMDNSLRIPEKLSIDY